MPFPVPVRIRGIDYPSISSAAAALGVKPNTVQGALERGTIDNVGLRGWPGRKPVTIRGVRYLSIAAAANALGLSERSINKAMKNGYLDTVGARKNRA